MPRSNDAEYHMRMSFNDILGKYNELVNSGGSAVLEGASWGPIRIDLRALWDDYWADGFIESDHDIVHILNSLTREVWPPDIVFRASMHMAEFLNRPIVTKKTAALNLESCYLLEKHSSDTSQGGENGIIAEVFNTMGIRNRWCVEFGAWDGKHLSDTYNLIVDDGWNGVLIEGIEKRFRKLQDTYAGIDRAHLFNMMIGFDPERDTIDHILSRTEALAELDLMVIDIDGNDWHVWRSMETYRPRLVVIELNPTIPNDVYYVQERDPDVQRGCSLSALIELGKLKGYELVSATIWNGLFVVQEEFEKFGIADNSIDAMFRPFMDGRIFHCFDSSIHVIGMPSIMWDMNKLGRDVRTFLPDRLHIYD